MSNERPYRLALLGTSPVSDGGSAEQTKSLPVSDGGKLNAVNRKPPLPQRGRWHAQRDGGGALAALDKVSRNTF